MKKYLKPAISGFIIFVALILLLIAMYAFSGLYPVHGEWEMEKNDGISRFQFPLKQSLSDEEFIILRKQFKLLPGYDHITFTIYPTIEKASVYINGEYVFRLDSLESMEENVPPYIFLSYRIPNQFLNQDITLEIFAYGSQTINIQYYPMISNPHSIKMGSLTASILESHILIFATGFLVMLSFILLSLAFNDRERYKSYFFIGVGTILQAFYLMISVLLFHSSYIYSQRIFNLFPLLLLVSFNLLYQGIERFIKNKNDFTTNCWKVLPFFALFYLFVPLNHQIKMQITAIYVIIMTLFMIKLSVKERGRTYLTTIFFFTILTYLYDFFIKDNITIFPMPALQPYAIMAIGLVTGSFFSYTIIRSYKTERKLRLELSESYEEIHTSNEELESSYHEIEQLNDSLEQKVRERTEKLNLTVKDLKMILNNTDEGFLTLDKLQRAENTFSIECERIFGFPPCGVKLSQLLYPNEMENAAFMDNIIMAIQQEESELRREAYLSLLPEQLMINGLFVELEYKWIEDAIPGEKQLMIILRDMTSKHELENMVETERNNLSKIVKIMLNLEEFMRMDVDYREFMDLEVFRTIEESKSFEKTFSFIKRRVHTFKGNLASFGLTEIAEKLHLLEDDLSQLIVDQTKNPHEKLNSLKILFSERDTVGWLSQEEDRIKQDISTDIFREERFYRVYPEQLESLKNRLATILPKELLEPVRQEVGRIEYRSIKELFNYYRFVVENLSEKLGKTINPLKIRGNNYYVDSEHYNKWISSLIHLFRNSIDHGIESADERIMAGKSEYGQITVDIRKNGSELKIEISDDGRGMNPETLAKTAVKKGLKTDEETSSMTDEQRLSLVFLDGFSTKKETTLISGRGVGLSSVKQEWESLGGTVQLLSETNRGTKFIFILEIE